MGEFVELLGNPAHWGFEVATDLVKFSVVWVVGSLIPDRWNPVKRWVARHDREHHT